MLHQQPQQQPQVLAALASGQQQARPAHAQRHVQHMTELLLSCDSLLKLQAVLSIHLHQFTPSCITAAMKQLHKLRQQELQSASTGCSLPELAPMLQALQLQLAGQLTQALIVQLSVVSGSCLAAFLAAAANMKLVMPAAVLEQIAGHLVNKALRAACATHNAAAAAGAASHQPDRSTAERQQHAASWQAQQPGSSYAAGEPSSSPHQSGQQQQQQEHPRQQPHVAALSAWALAKLKLRSEVLWTELVSIAGENLPAMSPNDCVMLAYACAKAGQHQSRLFSSLRKQLLPHVARLPPASISCLLWSYAWSGQYHHALVSALAGAAANTMERFSPQDLATSAWACGRLRHADARMLSALRVQALACMSDMRHQALSNLAWSLATLGLGDEALTAAVISRAMQLADGFHAQGLANVAWAVVKLQQQPKHSNASASQYLPSQHSSSASVSAATSTDHTSRRRSVGQHTGQLGQQQSTRDLLQVLCSAAVPRLPTASPQEVCNLLWACATVQFRPPDEPFLTAAATRIAAVAEVCAPLDLAQALWALETLRFRRKATQQALLQSALNRLHQFDPQPLSNLAWAVASSGMQYPRGLPEAVAQQLQALLPQMTPQGMATTLWALSKMGRVPQQLVHAASRHISAQLPLYNAQDLCNVAMVVAKAGYREPQLLQDLAAAASSAAALTLGAAGGGSSSSSQGSTPAHAVSSTKRVNMLTATGVCNLVWAFAGSGWCDVHLMQQLQQVAVLHLPQLQPRNIAALCQGFALLGQPFDQLLTALQATPPRSKHKGMKPQQQPSQYQQHQQHLQGLQERLGGQAAASQLDLQARDLSGLLSSWPADSLALLLHALVVTSTHEQHPALLLAVLRQLTHKVSSDPLNQQRHCQLHMALTYLALQWGCASVVQQGHMGTAPSSSGTSHTLQTPQYGSGSASLGQTAARGVGGSSLVQELLRDALAVEATGCCKAGDVSVPCQARPGAAAADHQAPADHTAQQISGTAAGAVVQVPSSAQLDPESSSSPASAGQLHGRASELVTGTLGQLCLRSWQQHEAVRQLSRVEHEVAGVLQAMGLQPLCQHWLQLTYSNTNSRHAQSSTAAAARWTSRALAVNVGLAAGVLGAGRGPVALCALPPAALSSSIDPRQVLGQTLLEHRCLEAAGWQVVWFSWEEWDSLGGNHTQQQALLHSILSGV